MVLVVTQDGYLVSISGTIAEVLAEIQDQKLTKIISYIESGGNARALCSRIKT